VAAERAPERQQSASVPAASTHTIKGSMQEPGQQRSASSDLPGPTVDPDLGSWQPGGSVRDTPASQAAAGTAQQARELQQLRGQLAEVQQRLDSQATAQAVLHDELEDARRAAKAAAEDAEDARRQVCCCAVKR
jgi:hypothetical protein